MPRRSLTTSGVALALCAATSAACVAAEYSFVPSKTDGAAGTTVITCRTPAGWTGWKDDPHDPSAYPPSSRELIEAAMSVQVEFSLLNCSGESCPSLSLDTRARNSPGPPDIKAAVAWTARELSDTTAPATKSGSFDGGPAGRLTLWRFRRSGEHCFLTVIAERDVEAILSLCGTDLGQTRGRLDSLKELARSVRIGPGSFTSADIISIGVGQSDAAIRQQLLELTPPGRPKDAVFQLLDNRLRKTPLKAGEPPLRRRGNDLEAGLGHHSDGPFHKIVTALWRFGRNQKLRDIEVIRVEQ